jgi:hypothetical protein
VSEKRKAPGTQATRCLLCHIRPATAKDICTVCEGRMRRDAAAAAALGLRLEAFQPEGPQPRPKLNTTLLSLDRIAELIQAGQANGAMHKATPVAPDIIIEHFTDLKTGDCFDRITCTSKNCQPTRMAQVVDTWTTGPDTKGGA